MSTLTERCLVVLGNPVESAYLLHHGYGWDRGFTWKLIPNSGFSYALQVIHISVILSSFVSSLHGFTIRLLMTAGGEAEFQGLCQRETTFSSFYLCRPKGDLFSVQTWPGFCSPSILYNCTCYNPNTTTNNDNNYFYSEFSG